MSSAREQDRGARGGRGGNRGAGAWRGGGYGGHQDDGTAAAPGGGGRGRGGRTEEGTQGRRWDGNKPMATFDPDRYEDQWGNNNEGGDRGNTGGAASGGRGRGASRGGGDYQGPRRTRDSGAADQPSFDGQDKPGNTSEGGVRGYSGGALRGGRGRGASRGVGDSQDSLPIGDIATGQSAFDGQDNPGNTIRGVVHGDSSAPVSTRGRGAAARGRTDYQGDRRGRNDGTEQSTPGEAADAFGDPQDGGAATASGERGRGRGGRGGAGQGRKWDGVARGEDGAAPWSSGGTGAARGRSDYRGDRRGGDDGAEQSTPATNERQKYSGVVFVPDDKPVPGFSSQRRGRAVGNAARPVADPEGNSAAAVNASDFNADYDVLAVQDNKDAPAFDYPVAIPGGRGRGGGPNRREMPSVGGSLQPAPSLDDNDEIVAPKLEDNAIASSGARRNRSEFPKSDEPGVPANATGDGAAARPRYRRPGLGDFVLKMTSGHFSSGGQREGGESSRLAGQGGGNSAGTASGNRSRDGTDAGGNARNNQRQDNKGSYGGRRTFDNRNAEPSDNATAEVQPNLGGNIDRQETTRGRGTYNPDGRPRRGATRN